MPPPFFNPSQPAPNAGARAQGIPLRAYPDEGTLTPANGNFLSPRLTSPEIILSKTSATPAPSREIEVKYFCSSNAPTDSTPLDTGNGYKVKGIVNIVYKTGATDDLGDEIQEKAVVEVTATCIAPKKVSTTFNLTTPTYSQSAAWVRVRFVSQVNFRVVDYRLDFSPNTPLPPVVAEATCKPEQLGQMVFGVIEVKYGFYNASGFLLSGSSSGETILLEALCPN